jgi:hypothetical protein
MVKIAVTIRDNGQQGYPVLHTMDVDFPLKSGQVITLGNGEEVLVIRAEDEPANVGPGKPMSPGRNRPPMSPTSAKTSRPP